VAIGGVVLLIQTSCSGAARAENARRPGVHGQVVSVPQTLGPVWMPPLGWGGLGEVPLLAVNTLLEKPEGRLETSSRPVLSAMRLAVTSATETVLTKMPTPGLAPDGCVSSTTLLVTTPLPDTKIPA